MLRNFSKGAVALGAILASAALVNGRVDPAQAADKTLLARQQIERGKYLVEGPMHCYACHSPADWTRHNAPPLPGRKGAGAYIPDDFMPFKVAAPNITPDLRYGIGAWTDAELLNALRNGIGKDGRVLFPIMPYMFYRNMSDDDLKAVIAYIRTQRPLAIAAPKSDIPPPVKALLKAPAPVSGQVSADLSNAVKRGEYLAMAGNCAGCHTPVDFKTLQPMMQLAYSGGQPMHGPWGKVASANLTPDASGISYYDEKLFFQAMRTGHVGARRLAPIMLSRGYFSRMTDGDLRDLFAFLRSLPPVRHRVDNTEKPTPCRLCNGVHGAGELN